MRPISEPGALLRFLTVGGVVLALLFMASCFGSSENTPPSATSATKEPISQPATEVSESGWKWVSEPTYGFAASVPAHWEREITQEPDTLTTYFSYRPSNITDKSQRVIIDVVVSQDPESVQDIDMSASVLMRRLEEVQNRQGDNVLLPPRTTSLGSYPAAWSVMEYTPTDSTEILRTFAIFASTKSAFYIVKVAGFPEYGEGIEAVFDHLRDTIQLTESKWTPMETANPTPQKQTESPGSEATPMPQNPTAVLAEESDLVGQALEQMSAGRDTAEIVKKDVNLRQAPTRDSAIVTPIPKGAKVQVIGRLSDGKWLKVSWNGHTAWVRRGLVAASRSLEQIPVVPY